MRKLIWLFYSTYHILANPNLPIAPEGQRPQTWPQEPADYTWKYQDVDYIDAMTEHKENWLFDSVNFGPQ